MSVRSSFQHISTLLVFAAVAVLFGFLAPSLMGLVLLALLVIVPVAVLAGVTWLVARSVLGHRKPIAVAEPETEQ